MQNQNQSYPTVCLNHALEKSVDFVLAVAVVTTLHEVVVLSSPAAVGRVELEGPEEVGGLLEAGSDREDLVDQVLHADDVALACGTRRTSYN